MQKVKVRVTLELEVEIPPDTDYDVVFDIEENHCPGTGLVGAAIQQAIAEHTKNNTCWGCALNGKNEIL